jgi:methionine synthase / methylenetetrahydrofolate reductase(NADPH)
MKQSLLDYIQGNLLIGDGAMGTLLHSQGVPIGSCVEMLNNTHPEIIRDIHLSYRRAGANLIETNTYGANAEKLSKFGLEDQVDQINRAAVKIAREAAGDDAFVVGAVGGIMGGIKKDMNPQQLERAFQQQIDSLVAAGVDGIILETFCHVDEALLAITLARKYGQLPVICQLSIQDIQRTLDGHLLEDAFNQLIQAGAHIVGLNCYNGPANLIRSLETIPLEKGYILSAYPNAGIPSYVGGKMIYSTSPDYFGTSAKTLYELGVRIMGGCCGTTPEHIAAVSSVLQGKAPITVRQVIGREQKQDQKTIHVSPPPQQNTLPEMVREKTTVIVELDPPRDLDYPPFIEGAKALKEAGADAITLADNSLAITRMSNLALGALVKEKIGIPPLLHVACRDRNLIGQQSHLMGLYALGIDHVLVVTGDPTRYGDLPGASSVYDMNSFELISMIKKLNEGIAFSGRPLKNRSTFTVGAAFNPNTRHLNKAVERLEKKIEAGADFIMTQPFFCKEQIKQVAAATQHLSIPIFPGIMPLTSQKNAEFLHNEVPGIQIPDEVRDRMAGYQGEDARKQGVEIAKELVDTALAFFQGIYLITPFMRYEMTAELTRYVKNRNSHS